MTLQGLNNCLDNTKLWHIMNQLNKIYKKKIILTPKQRFTLCRYVNENIPFNKKVLNDLISELKL